MLMAVCNQADSREQHLRQRNGHLGAFRPVGKSANKSDSYSRYPRHDIYNLYDEQGNLAADVALFILLIPKCSVKSLKSDGIDYNGQRYIINCDFFSPGEIRCITNRYDTSYSQNVQWVAENRRHYKMCIYNGSYTEQELLDMCSLTRIDF